MNRLINMHARKVLTGRNGSSAVMLAIIFTGFAVCVAAAIGVSRRLVVSSECEMLGRLWTKAILSEYDIHLLEDYSIMAYFGNDAEVSSKLDTYLKYSAKGRLGAKIKGANADLTGYELGDLENFRTALKMGSPYMSAGELLTGWGRTYRNLDSGEGFDEEGRIINNPVVIDTLPSHGTGGCVSGEMLTERAKSVCDEKGLLSAAADAGAEIVLIGSCFDNHVTKADVKEHLLVNEWEYIIRGSTDDEVNYRACRNRLFIARNALNLVALYRDPAKAELVASVAEAITPGPLGLATQILIAEAWAALETEEDLDELYNDRRVPVLKSPDQWKTDIKAVLGSKEIRDKLDDEARQILDENQDEVDKMSGRINTVTQFKDGLNYDEYLMLMILSMNENTRLLRAMDLIQINMKFRYYADFNMMEYYTGVRFTIDANGNSHEFEDSYK